MYLLDLMHVVYDSCCLLYQRKLLTSLCLLPFGNIVILLVVIIYNYILHILLIQELYVSDCCL